MQPTTPVGYSNTDFGFGLDDYFTQPERASMVRWWRWQWVTKKDVQGRLTGQHRIKTRKFHLPEAIYLAVLASVLQENGWLEDAANIKAMIVARHLPAEKIVVRYVPDICSRGSYHFDDQTKEYHDCLCFLLEQRDFEKARIFAMQREGYAIPWPKEDKIEEANSGVDGKVLSYSGETLMLCWDNDTTTEVGELAYLDVLEQLLTLHRLPSLHGDNSPYPTVLFRPQVQDVLNYRLTPRTKDTVTILETLLAFPWLEDVAKQVLRTQPVLPGIATHEGHGFLFQEGTVVITHRHRSQHEGGWELTVSKPEFLSVLAALLKARAFHDYTQQIEALMPLEPVAVDWQPDLYWVRNYRIVQFDARATDCLEIILCRNDLEQPRDEARRRVGFRSGYYMVFGPDWNRGGRIKLILPDGNDRIVPEGLYLNVLEQVLKLNGLEGVLL